MTTLASSMAKGGGGAAGQLGRAGTSTIVFLTQTENPNLLSSTSSQKCKLSLSGVASEY